MNFKTKTAKFSSRKILLSVLLAVAFCTVFAITLSGIADLGFLSGAKYEVAEASNGGGGTTPIALTPGIEEFAGTAGSSNYTDTYTHEFTSLSAANSTGNVSFYHDTGSSTTCSLTVGLGSFTYTEDGTHSVLYTPDDYVAINIKLTSNYLYYLLTTGYVNSITANYTYTLSFANTNKHNFGSKIQQNTTTINASSKTSCSTTEYTGGSIFPMTNSCAVTSGSFAGNATSGYYTYFNFLFLEQSGNNDNATFTVDNMKVEFVAKFPLESGKPKLTASTITNSITSITGLPVNFTEDQNSNGTPDAYETYPELQTALQGALDGNVMSTATGETAHVSTINMRSYRQTSVGTVNSTTYYKRVSLTFNDYYGSTKDTTGSSSATGIRRIEVGDNIVFYVYAASSLNSIITIDDVDVGYIQFSRSNKSVVTATLYFYTNSAFTINVVDYGGYTNMTSVVVSGIDHTNPDKPVSLTDANLLAAPSSQTSDSYLSTYNTALWLNPSTLSLSVDALSAEAGEAPVLYFYNVSYSLTGQMGTFTDLQNNTLDYPSAPGTYGKLFAYGTVSSLNLDFNALSGSGYYIVAIQAKDLAANVSTYDYTARYFIKVDCDGTAFTVNMTKGMGETPYVSGTWATDQIVAEISVTSRADSANGYHSETNLSGNVLAYTGADYKDHYVTTFGGYITASDLYGTLTNAGTAEAVYFDGTLTITYSHGVYTVVCGNLSYVESSITKYNEVDLSVVFTVYSGASVDTEYFTANDPEIVLRSDRNNPMTPVVSDEDTFKLVPAVFTSTDIAISSRDWYTTGWNIQLATQFSDDMMENFSNDIMLYIGVNVNRFLPSFSSESVLAEYLTGAYESYNACLTSLGCFDSFASVTSTTVDGGGSILLDLLQASGSGLRNIYVWAVDQAYNTSSATAYQLLVDGNTYGITPQIDAETINHFDDVDVASFEYFNDDGEPATTFKRGETLTIMLTVTQGFIPYKIALALDGVYANDFYVNDTLNCAYVSPYPADLTLTMENLNITMLVDKNSITDSPVTAAQTYTFSFRKVVGLSLGNTVVYYNGYRRGIDYVVSNPDFENLPLAGFPSSDFAEFTATYYTQYTDAENNALTTADSGALTDGSAPKHVGQYYVNAKVDGQFYVSENLFSSYKINKYATTLTADGGSSSYGDDITLTATLAAVGEDIADVPSPVSGALALKNRESLTNVPADVYNVVMGEAITYRDYEITFVSALYTVNPKTVNITVTAGQSKIYDEADPAFAYTVDEGQVFNDNINNIILGGGIIRELGEEASATGYAYSTSAAGFTLNPNYTLNIQSSDNFVIGKKTVTVIPVANQTAIYNAETTDYGILFNLATVERKYLEYIVGALSFAAPAAVGSNEISLDGLTVSESMAQNLDLALSGAVNFILLEAGDVNITAKAALSNSISYGSPCPSDSVSDMFDFSSEKFDVTGTGLSGYAYYRIVWEWAISTYIQGNDVGCYAVDFANLTIYAGDDEATATDVTGTLNIKMGNVFLRVVPAVISVEISNTAPSRTYGGVETVLDYNILCSVGNAESWGIVAGSFRRVVCDSEGNTIAVGTRYDCVNAGLALTYGEGSYYGAELDEKFTCNGNYVIQYGNLSEVRYTVAPFDILLTDSSFCGKSREYNGLTSVIYSADETAVIFAKSRVTDDVKILFAANYNTADVAASGKLISFSELRLSGTDCMNYSLRYNGNAVDGGTIVTITKLTSESASNDIAVSAAEIEILKADIEISKIYDGTTAVSGVNVTFKKGLLSGLDNSAVSASGNFQQTGIGTSLTVSVVIHVALSHADTNLSVLPCEEDNISVQVNSGEIVITVVLLNASITKRPLTLSDFIFTGIDKRYDATSTASVSYEYNAGALGAGDVKSAVPVSFTAYFGSENGGVYDAAANAGAWTVMLTGATVSNANYMIDISSEDFAAYNSIKANILPTRLLLDIDFDLNRQYDGTSTVVYTTENKVKVYGDDPSDATELASLSFVLTGTVMSLYGAENTQVIFGDAAKTQVLMHNVMFSGVAISSSGAALLSNYVLVGYVYNAVNETYEMTEIPLGGTLTDFEMVAAATLKRKELNITTSSITINDKYYDSTAVGTGSINKNTIGLVESEKDFIGIDFSVEFTGVDVNPSLKAYIRVLDIVNEASAGETDYACNYLMTAEASIYAFGYAAIKQAPLTFDIALADKTYDGTRNGIIMSYTLHGIIDSRDQNKYALDYRFGAFSSIDAGQNVTGSAYGLALSYNGYTSGTGSYMNYILTYAVTQDQWAAENGEALASAAANFYMTKTVNNVQTHYFKLLKKQFSKILSTDYDSETYGFVYYIEAEGSLSYYYVDYTGSGEYTELNGFEAAAGNINKKVVTVNAALTEEGLAELDKDYDGTTAFHGEEGTHYNVTISGICMNEDVTIAEGGISVAYDNANASALAKDRVLVFSVTALSGTNSANYSFDGAVARFSATISRVDLDVSIDSLVVNYGDAARNYQYHFSDEVHDLLLIGGQLGYYSDVDGNPETPDEFVILDPSITLPKVTDNTNNFTNSGVYALTLSGGNSTNYNFVFQNASYGGTTENGDSYSYENVAGVIVINKTVIYAYAVDKYEDAANAYEYMRIFRAANPSVTLAYSSTAAGTANGLRNGQTASGLISAGLFVAPVVTFMTFDTSTGTWGAEVGTDAVVNSSLTNTIYAINLNVDNAICRNYIIKVRSLEQYKDNEPALYGANDFTRFGNYVEQLYVTYAAIEGITVKAVSATYDGNAHNTSASGTLSGDTVTTKAYLTKIETYDNNGTPATRTVPDYDSEINVNSAVNAGTYYFEVTVKRTNYLDWVGGAYVTVNPQTVSLTLRRLVVNYDGNRHNITENRDVTIGDSSVSKDDITYIYKLNGVTQNNTPKNAGSYLVQACFNPETATHTANPSNYAYSTSPAVSLIINPIIVNIEVPVRQIVYDENADNSLQYTATMDSAFEGFPMPDISVFYRDPYSDDSVDGVYYAGNYSYTIKTFDANYQLTGNTTGVYYVGISSVAEIRDDDSAPRASAVVTEGALIYANTEITYNVKSNNSSNSTLWSQVNSNVSIIGTFFKPLETSAILDVSMVQIINEVTNKVQPNGEVVLTMELPKGAANGDRLYVVTSDGTLKELSYTYSDGMISVTTDYVGYFVFVKSGSFPWWFIGVIGGALVLGAVIAILAVVQKKKKIRDAQLVTVGTNPDGTPIQITFKEKREKEKLEEQTRIAEQKKQAEQARLAEEKRIAEEKAKNKAAMTSAAAQPAQPQVKTIMKAAKADNVQTAKMVSAQKAVAADVAEEKPKIMKALSVDEPVKGKPAPSVKVEAPLGKRPPMGGKPVEPNRPQGGPPAGARPQGASSVNTASEPNKPQGGPPAGAKLQGGPPTGVRPQGAPPAGARPHAAPPKPDDAKK